MEEYTGLGTLKDNNRKKVIDNVNVFNGVNPYPDLTSLKGVMSTTKFKIFS